MLAEFPVPLPLVDNAPESSYSFCFTAGKYPVSPSMFGGHPNIVGAATEIYAQFNETSLTGAFCDGPTDNTKTVSVNWIQGRTLGLDASRCSPEYVTGASLQHSALQILCCIKF